MSKKNLFLILLAAGLATVYAVYFTDWLAPKTFEVFHTFRQLRMGQPKNGAIPSLIFAMNRRLALTEVKVVPLAAWETNKHVLPLWHLVTESNSVPMKSFSYGQFIPGLHAAIKGTHPETLATNIVYCLLIHAGQFEANHHFELE